MEYELACACCGPHISQCAAGAAGAQVPLFHLAECQTCRVPTVPIRKLLESTCPYSGVTLRPTCDRAISRGGPCAALQVLILQSIEARAGGRRAAGAVAASAPLPHPTSHRKVAAARNDHRGGTRGVRRSEAAGAQAGA
eukprot:CAMPEP_0115882560 /NCGR_PEP_ID=MMETSP0287-20121206/29070_1 /TAXON_ID=412157 /ORGANISM="Chrysochromulina rotalis, Strain UIO044" /LENGTH=138 /DNA_ID=CAMNT_0003338647 /DNA_START=543 /DNA_END=958 /DNA_ORIENTATION=+